MEIEDILRHSMQGIVSRLLIEINFQEKVQKIKNRENKQGLLILSPEN